MEKQANPALWSKETSGKKESLTFELHNFLAVQGAMAISRSQKFNIISDIFLLDISNIPSSVMASKHTWEKRKQNKPG